MFEYESERLITAFAVKMMDKVSLVDEFGHLIAYIMAALLLRKKGFGYELPANSVHPLTK